MSKIHYTIDPPCKCQKRWDSTQITSTRNIKDVSCKNCLKAIGKVRQMMEPFIPQVPTEEEERYQAWLTKRREEIKADYEAEYGKDDEPCPYCDEYICECDD